MSKSKQAFVAAVMVTCYVAGVRTNLQPGDELPADLPQHDIDQLLRMKAIRSPAAEQADAAAAAKAEQAASAEFAAARASVQAAAESVAPPPAEGSDPAPAPPAGKSKAKA